jgi:hypothetical protein
VRALVRRRQPRRAVPHKRTAPVRMRRVPPKASTVLFSSRARARVAAPTDLVACEHPIALKRKAVARGAIDSEALVCSGSRCSCP